MRPSIYNLLKNFTSLDALKRLIWTELNYDRVSDPVSTRDWNETEREMLHEDPQLFAGHEEFKVIYGQMKDGLNRTDERAIVTKLLKNYPYALFVFSDKEQRHWHFVNVKYDRDTNKRRIFRRITVDAGSDRLRTAAERLELLDLETVSRDLYGIPPLAIQQRHDQAFDVEAVTREFFRSYDRLFRDAEDYIVALGKDERRLFTQKLFNRLMFIVFLERKGWLSFNGRTDYLRTLWHDYKEKKDPGDNFYWARLVPLFFSGLNYPYDLRVSKGTYLHEIIGNVPYLNGGLFERENDDDNRNIQIPDVLFERVIEDLFYRYNFTIAESTPLDVEVAVDPEMLGKIFEELVTGRHETGSYYTPKPIVSFMCREALKGFLQTATQESPSVIGSFVDDYDASNLKKPEDVLSALRGVTVCDPACGSGAYLLGMLQELLQLRASLFTAKKVDARSVYDRKLEIIQRNIYGVDLDPFAVNVARLRLWLSLIVDFEVGREGEHPPTLPNLEYKIEVGDSVLGPDPSTNGLREFDRLLVEQYTKAKEHYLSANSTDKKPLHAEVEELQAQIRMWARQGKASLGFDWAVEFAEVFDGGGFDVVLANPPYVRQGLITDLKPALKNIYGDFYSGMADLFTYFYARAIQMLKPSGMLSFISSNKWLRADYGAKLRALLSTTTKLQTLIDFGDLPVFGAIAYPVIVTAQKQPPNGSSIQVLLPKNLDRIDDLRGAIEDEAITIPTDSLGPNIWSFGDTGTSSLMLTIRSTGVPLSEYVKGQIYRGVLTGFNRAFVINGATRAALIAQDPNSAELIKPFLRGRDVKRWSINSAGLWLIFTRRGVNINNYPAVQAYLADFKTELEPRPRDWPTGKPWTGRKPGSYRWHEIQDEVAYFSKFEQPKIIVPAIVNDAQFCYDESGYYSNDKTSIISTDDRYLLAVLNSRPAFRFLQNIAASKQGGFYEMKPMYIKQLPIPEAPPSDRAALAGLVQVCLDKKGIGVETIEQQINERVAELYGLKTDQE